MKVDIFQQFHINLGKVDAVYVKFQHISYATHLQTSSCLIKQQH